MREIHDFGLDGYSTGTEKKWRRKMRLEFVNHSIFDL